MGLLESPSGHLTNLSTAPTVRHGDALVVPLFPSASDPHGRQGVLRIINQSDERGDVYIKAYDDSEWDYRSLSLTIEANAAVHLNSDDLELGNADKGLRGRTGAASAGDWRLRITTDLDVEALAYVRHRDGFLTSMHDVAPAGTCRTSPRGPTAPTERPPERGHNEPRVRALETEPGIPIEGGAPSLQGTHRSEGTTNRRFAPSEPNRGIPNRGRGALAPGDNALAPGDNALAPGDNALAPGAKPDA